MSIRTILRAIGVAAMSLVACFASPPLLAQAPDENPSAAEPAPMEGEIAVRVETFGVGNIIRAGDWAGIRLALKDSSDRPRTVAVRLHLDDSDGDTTLHSRIVTMNPGQELGTWLYARMPWDLVKGSILRVSIAEAIPADDGTVRTGRQLSWKPIAVANALPPSSSIAYVVGASALALDQYSITARDRDTPAAAHEAMQVIPGLVPENLPDLWTGLAAGEALLWSDGDPSLLSEDRARAIREWVNRGGHLVIVLPGIGSAWTSPANPLADLLPTCAIDRLAEVDMAPYSLLLSGTAAPRPTLRAPLHRFTIARDTSIGDATPLITGPHGVIAVRRLAGAGMVTVIGLDLNNRAFMLGGWIRADAFWSRILGRRAATPTQAEIDAATAKRGLINSNPEIWVDERIMSTISRSREAGLGVLLALVLFVLYWVLAGPLGFFILRAKGLERHAWMGFVFLAVIFTAFAWAGAQSLRPKLEEAWHMTILDHVYGQSVDRARTFVSVLLPHYGDQRVTLGQPGADERWNQALTPLADPVSLFSAAFPDARAYISDVRDMTTLDVPARSTIKTFQGDWLGGPRWSMPQPESPEQTPRIDATGRLVGVLKHDLPSSLENPRILLVTGQVALGLVGRTIAVPPAVGKIYAWQEPSWEPGTPLDLSKFQPSVQANATKRLDDLVPRVSIINQSLPASVKDDDLDDAVALFGLLQQPELDRSNFAGTTFPATAHRRLTHTMDLAKWCTQPCLIIIGAVEHAPNPVPMSVDGHALDARDRPSSGRTVLRWIYPLQPAPLRVEGSPASLSPADTQ